MGLEPLATQATAHSLHAQALVATRPLARQCQSEVGLHPYNPSLMDYYSFNRPRRDGRLSRPCWLTDSGRFTHKEVTRPSASLAQDRENTPAEPAVLTTMPLHQLVFILHLVEVSAIILLLFRVFHSCADEICAGVYICRNAKRAGQRHGESMEGSGNKGSSTPNCFATALQDLVII